MKWIMLFLISTSAMAIDQFGQLEDKDMPYFKNNSGEGRNKIERIDMNVQEINKLHGEVNGLRNEINMLKQEVEELKKKK